MSSADLYRNLPNVSFRGFNPPSEDTDPPPPPTSYTVSSASSLKRSSSFESLVEKADLDDHDRHSAFKEHILFDNNDHDQLYEKADLDLDLEESVGGHDDKTHLLHLPALAKHPEAGRGQAESKETVSDEFLVTISTSSPLHPFNFSLKKKYFILALICSAAMCVTATSSIESSAIKGIMKGLNSPFVGAMAGLSLFVIGMGMGGGECFNLILSVIEFDFLSLQSSLVHYQNSWVVDGYTYYLVSHLCPIRTRASVYLLSLSSF
jgi:hypothetical protein